MNESREADSSSLSTPGFRRITDSMMHMAESSPPDITKSPMEIGSQG